MSPATIKPRGKGGEGRRSRSRRDGPRRGLDLALVIPTVILVGAAFTVAEGLGGDGTDQLVLVGVSVAAAALVLRFGPTRRWGRFRRGVFASGVLGAVFILVWNSRPAKEVLVADQADVGQRVAIGSTQADLGTLAWIGLTLCALLILGAVLVPRIRRRSREREESEEGRLGPLLR